LQPPNIFQFFLSLNSQESVPFAPWMFTWSRACEVLGLLRILSYRNSLSGLFIPSPVLPFVYNGLYDFWKKVPVALAWNTCPGSTLFFYYYFLSRGTLTSSRMDKFEIGDGYFNKIADRSETMSPVDGHQAWERGIFAHHKDEIWILNYGLTSYSYKYLQILWIGSCFEMIFEL